MFKFFRKYLSSDWKFLYREYFIYGVILGCFTIMFWEFRPTSPSDMASWIQAVGSILAILAAVNLSRRSESLERERKRKAYFAVLDHVSIFVKKLDENFSSSDYKNCSALTNIHKFYHQSVIDGMSRALNNIPVVDMHTGAAVGALLSLQSQMIFLEESIVNFLNFNNEIKDRWDRNSIKYSPDIADEMDDMCRKTLYGVREKNIRTNMDLINSCIDVVKNSI